MATDSLFDTIGGRIKINAAVESFYKNVLADESLRPLFEGVGMDHLRARQSMFVSMLLGGKIVYTGKDIGAAHDQPRRMGMNESHFETFLNHFRAALEEVGVQSDKLEQIIKLLGQSRGAILNR
ncbi:MAG: group 1 truncated hemoglobin [Candidatus Acidiferrales bacterium]